MKDFNEIQSAWKQSFFSPKTELISMINLAKSYERNRHRFLIIQLTALLILFPFFVFRFFNHFSMSVTEWGYPRIILSVILQCFIAFVIFFKFRELLSVRRLMEILSPVTYMEVLKKYHQQLKLWYGYLFPGFIVLWFIAGMAANYFPEGEHALRNWIAMIVLAVAIWGAVMLAGQLLFWNKMKFRNQMVSELERLQKQLTEE